MPSPIETKQNSPYQQSVKKGQKFIILNHQPTTKLSENKPHKQKKLRAALSGRLLVTTGTPQVQAP